MGRACRSCCTPSAPICFNATSCGNAKPGASVVVKDSMGTTVASGTTATGTGQFCTPNLSDPSYTWTVSFTGISSGVFLSQTGTASPGATVNVNFLCHFAPPNTPSSATLVDSLFGTSTLTYGASVTGPCGLTTTFNGNGTASVSGVPNAHCGNQVASDPRTTISVPICYSITCIDGVPQLTVAFPFCSFSVSPPIPAQQYNAPTDAWLAPFSSSANCIMILYPSTIANDTCGGLNVTYTVPAGPTTSRSCGTPTSGFIDTKDIYAPGATINVHF